MSQDRSAEAWLADARALLEAPGALGASAPRSVALLSRIALEEALRSWLDRNAPGARAANFSVQLLCLQHYADDKAFARRVAWTWEALSRATHHHGYELPPLTVDLQRWLQVVEALAVQRPE